jgi:hypothetical protein
VPGWPARYREAIAVCSHCAAPDGRITRPGRPNGRSGTPCRSHHPRLGGRRAPFYRGAARKVTPGEVRSTALYTSTETEMCKAARRTRNPTRFSRGSVKCPGAGTRLQRAGPAERPSRLKYESVLCCRGWRKRAMASARSWGCTARVRGVLDCLSHPSQRLTVRPMRITPRRRATLHQDRLGAVGLQVIQPPAID